jgi:hypothetical protein
MRTKNNTDRLGLVMFTYTGTDQDFDEFLKMLIHDYLAVDQPYIGEKQNR